MKIVLAMNAPQIIEDWGYCSKFVDEKIRAERPLKPKGSDDKTWIRFHRRHGEWLVYAAAIYVNRFWEDEYLNDLISVACGCDMKTIGKREKELRELDSIIVPKNTKKEIKEVLGRDC